MKIIDRHGRTLDELDILKLHIGARDLAPGRSYSVVTKSGAPICGFLSNDPGEVADFVATAWALQGAQPWPLKS